MAIHHLSLYKKIEQKLVFIGHRVQLSAYKFETIIDFIWRRDSRFGQRIKKPVPIKWQ